MMCSNQFAVGLFQDIDNTKSDTMCDAVTLTTLLPLPRLIGVVRKSCVPVWTDIDAVDKIDAPLLLGVCWPGGRGWLGPGAVQQRYTACCQREGWRK